MANGGGECQGGGCLVGSLRVMPGLVNSFAWRLCGLRVLAACIGAPWLIGCFVSVLSTAPASNSIAMCTPTLCSAMPRPPVQELKEAAATRKPRKRRLPKGTSDYQAAWILDDRRAYKHTHECPS